MAGALTPKQRGALILKWGTVENAIEEALMRSPELRELWDTQYTVAWWPHTGDFWKAWWEDALPVLGLVKKGEVALQHEINDKLAAPARAGRRGTKGRRASAPYPRKAFQTAARLLTAGEDKREIARVTGIGRKRIDKIEAWLRPPKGGAVYEVESAPLDENAVVLRRLK
jgi:hypothetical protein